MKKSELSIAIVDINFLLHKTQHAENGAKHIQEAQRIFQYNLDVIVKKLSEYSNKAQAQNYLLQAKQQLDAQFEQTKRATMQSMFMQIQKAIETEQAKYNLIIPKSHVLYADSTLDITKTIQEKYVNLPVSFPPLPTKIDTPNLPPNIPTNIPANIPASQEMDTPTSSHQKPTPQAKKSATKSKA